ncbi:U2 small nuclear ribonucleoprotein auxiliary factor 35 kDa subunit-related protein 2 [Prorops nasuta]|uniref:U2 small nuclear ribonucleoprotein auxiliary factor 35 kDa subunit-related protein 2 n=1 Tax=Prorops nasuta TaxID=863751 RepID=UPI0034CD703B
MVKCSVVLLKVAGVGSTCATNKTKQSYKIPVKLVKSVKIWRDSKIETCQVMAECRKPKLRHKEWRRIAKKERRRRLRCCAAQERQNDDERLRAALERSADYMKYIEEKEVEERKQEEREKEEHDAREQLWLQEEVRAQEEWRLSQEKKLAAKQIQMEQTEKVRKEWEAKQEVIRKKLEEDRLKREEEKERYNELQKQINSYIDDGMKTPESLREIIESQPGKEACPFFTKTGACRYGDNCSRNHRRVCLSNVILIPAFYSHFSLEKNAAEYDTDISLEYESSEMRAHYREFYKDVVPELENFGKIRNIKCCCNTELHLRGNLYVEYYSERDAARALRGLKGRWYAGRRLNCEFSNISSWRGAVCGMQKCPKGRTCNFLHTLRNPHNEYNKRSPSRRMKESVANNQESSKSIETGNWYEGDWEEELVGGRRNWRWSESPEVELTLENKSVEKERHRRRHSHRHSHDSRHSRSPRSHRSSSSRRSSSSHRRHSRESDRSSSSRKQDRSKKSYKSRKDSSHKLERRSDYRETRTSDESRRSRASRITPNNEIPVDSYKDRKDDIDNTYNAVDTLSYTETVFSSDVVSTGEIINNKIEQSDAEFVDKKIVKTKRSKWDDEITRDSSPEGVFERSPRSIASTESDWSGSTDNSDYSPVRKQYKQTSNDGCDE